MGQYIVSGGFPQIPFGRDDVVRQRRHNFRETLYKRAANANNVRDKFPFDVRNGELTNDLTAGMCARNSRLRMTVFFP